jgi:hypothetical protein
MLQFYNTFAALLNTFSNFVTPLDVSSLSNLLVACSNFVETLDSHPFGSSILLSIIVTVCYTLVARRN